MQSKYVSAPCAPPHLIASPSQASSKGLAGREFALLAASSNQKKLAPRRVKLFSCGILVLIARHRAQPSIPQRVTKVVCIALLPQPSRGNFWPSHRRAKYVYTNRPKQAQTQNSSHGKISVHTQFGVWLTPQLQLQQQLQLPLQPGYYGTKKSVSHAN